MYCANPSEYLHFYNYYSIEVQNECKTEII